MSIVCSPLTTVHSSFPWKLGGPIPPSAQAIASPRRPFILDTASLQWIHLHRHARKLHAPLPYAASASAREPSVSAAVSALVDDSRSLGPDSSPAILWFKKDLRIDDHPGLCSASATFQSMLPVYVFDPYVLRGWDTRLLEALVEAVEDLKFALQGVGSNLIVRKGNMEHELTLLAKEVHASAIITEVEVEHEWIKAMSFLDREGPEPGMQCKIYRWRAPLYKLERHIPSSYKEFQSMRCSPEEPLQAPNSLPMLPNVLDKGCIPSISDLKESIRLFHESYSWLRDVQAQSVKSVLKKDTHEIKEPLLRSTDSSGGILKGFNSWRERYILASPYKALEKRREELAMDSKGKDETKNTGAGTITAIANLEAYLKFLEPTWRNDWKKLHETIMNEESKGPRGSSFRSLFGYSLMLGTISRRRFYHEALEYEKARNGGLLSPFGFSTFTAKAVVQEVKSAEWYRMLAMVKKLDSNGSKGWDIRTWSWRGFLIEYSKMGEKGLPVLLIHGFGASWEHYRDNIKSLADEGNNVWALSLLGFGRSEKPDVVYTQDLWAELIRDFIVEVVGEPVVLVGNSIGGYMASMVSGIWPQIVKSLVLLNTAGAIVPDYSASSYVEPKKRSAITWVASHLSLTYLRSAAPKILKDYYPMNPSRVDDSLTGEIIRASYDPGAAFVIEGVFCITNPFPLNWFTDGYKAKVYVVQGMKDPLSNNTEKVKLFMAYCRNATIESVNAGHCPHDEIPDEVNKLISAWVKQPEISQDAQTPLYQSAASQNK